MGELQRDSAACGVNLFERVFPRDDAFVPSGGGLVASGPASGGDEGVAGDDQPDAAPGEFRELFGQHGSVQAVLAAQPFMGGGADEAVRQHEPVDRDRRKQ